MATVQPRSLSISIFLHVAAVVIAAFGLPVLLPKKPDPVPMVMTVELLPISEVSNVKPSDKQIQKEQKAPTVKNTKPIPPTAKEPPKPVEPPKPKEPVKADPVQKPVFDPMKDAEPLPKEKEKEKPKEQEKEKPKEAEKKPDDFQKLLSQLQAEAKANQAKDAKDKTNQEENKTKSDAPYDDSMPLSISEKDTIRSQFIPCWTMPAGAKDAHKLVTKVKVKLQPDGTVAEATLASDQRGAYTSDANFRAAADSAIRAVYKCSPLKNLPADKYGSWKEMELTFDPSILL